MKYALVLISFLFANVLLYAQTPDWLWANTAGSFDVDAGRGISQDIAGNTYVTGFRSGVTNFGDFQINYLGTGAFVAKADANGNWIWASGSVSQNLHSFAIATDPEGNSFITGDFSGTAQFGSHEIISEGSSTSAFVACINSSGDWLWAKVIGGGGYGEERGSGIAYLAESCYVTGYYRGNVTFDDIELDNFSGDVHSLFVAKISSTGNWIWVESIGGTSLENDAYGECIACGYDNNILIGGTFIGTIDCGLTSLTSYGGRDIFIAQISDIGVWDWSISAGSASTESINSIAVDFVGNCYATGFYSQTVSFGDTLVTNNNGQYDVYVVKLNSDGNWEWVKSAGGPNNDYGKGIAVDYNCNCYVTGSYVDSLNFGMFSLSSDNGSSDIFVAKIDTNGNWVWALKTGDYGNDEGLAITVGNTGCCYVTGSYTSSVVFGSVLLTSLHSSSDLFIAKLQSGTVADEDYVIPIEKDVSLLYDVYPNPLRNGEMLQIKTDIIKDDSGYLKLFNLKGQCLKSHSLKSGEHQINFNSKGLASGIYFYQLKTSTTDTVKKLVLLK